MQIICKRRLHFQDHEIVDNAKTGEKVALVKQEIVVSPSAEPQLVPDWIKKTDLFNLCVDDGSITEVNVLSTPKTKGKASASTEKKDDPKALGWGSTPSSGLPNGNDISGDKNESTK